MAHLLVDLIALWIGDVDLVGHTLPEACLAGDADVARATGEAAEADGFAHFVDADIKVFGSVAAELGLAD